MTAPRPGARGGRMTKKKRVVPRGWNGDLNPEKTWEAYFTSDPQDQMIYLDRLSPGFIAGAGTYVGDLLDTLSIIVNPRLMRDVMEIAMSFEQFNARAASWPNYHPVLLQIVDGHTVATESPSRSGADHQVCLQFIDTGTSDGHRILVHGGIDVRTGTRETAVIAGARYHRGSEGLL